MEFEKLKVEVSSKSWFFIFGTKQQFFPKSLDSKTMTRDDKAEHLANRVKLNLNVQAIPSGMLETPSV